MAAKRGELLVYDVDPDKHRCTCCYGVGLGNLWWMPSTPATAWGLGTPGGRRQPLLRRGIGEPLVDAFHPSYGVGFGEPLVDAVNPSERERERERERE